LTVRALVITPDFPPAPGGIQLLVHRLVTNFERVESRVVALGVEGDEAFDESAEVAVRRVAAKGADRNRLAVARLNAAGLTEGLRQRPDVVICGHVVAAPAAAVLRRFGPRVVQYLHGDEFRTRPRLVRRAMRAADAVIAVSRHTSEMALAHGCDPERLRIISPGVDLPGPPVAARSLRPTVLTVARLVEPYKGHDVVIRALPLVRERMPEARWLVVGEGPLRPDLERLARSEGVEDIVDFRGSASDAERDRCYDEAHVFTMTSRLPEEGFGGEGFGIVYLEAGAHGLPSVAGDVAGARDAVIAGETGLLVDPTDPGAVAGALVSLLGDRPLAERMGAAARRHAESSAWPAVAARVEALLEELVAGRR